MKTIKRGVWIAAGALLLIAAVLLIAASRAPRPAPRPSPARMVIERAPLLPP